MSGEENEGPMNARMHHIIAVILVLLVACPVWAGNVIYVDDDAPLNGDGVSWDTAYRYLQDALVRSSVFAEASEGSHAEGAETAGKIEIRVAQGVYLPDRVSLRPELRGDQGMSFHLIDSTALKGGYAGLGSANPNAWDVGLYETVLSGDLAGNDLEVDDPCDLLLEPTRSDNSDTIIRISDANESAVLIGFTITGAQLMASGRGYTGGAMLNRSASPTISNCTFTKNASSQRGAAILNAENCSPNITDCVFSVNHAGNGGGIYGGNLSLTKCKFINNSAYGGGGVSGGSGLISNCMFINNSARGGGAISNYNGTVAGTVFIENSAEDDGGALSTGYNDSIILSNCVFSGNLANKYGGALSTTYGSSLTITNCTFFGNSAVNGNATACYSSHESHPPSALKITNCIVWNGGNEIWSNDCSAIEVSYTDFQDGEITIHDPCEKVVLGVGNINANPQFADPNDDDFHLKSQGSRWDKDHQQWMTDDVTSPCIDAGDPNSPIMYEPFANGGVINMGAYGGTAEASKSYFGEPPCETIVAGDINGDCRVDIADLEILMSHWLYGQ